MVHIQNTDAHNVIRQGAKLSLSEGYPTELQNTCVPVMDMTPNFHRKSNILIGTTQTTTAAFTVHTATADRDTYLTGATASIIKNATADTATGAVLLTVVQDTITKTIIALAVLTLTAQNQSIAIQFCNPIKIDRGSIVQMTGAFTAGNLIRSATLVGYEEESTN